VAEAEVADGRGGAKRAELDVAFERVRASFDAEERPSICARAAVISAAVRNQRSSSRDWTLDLLIERVSDLLIDHRGEAGALAIGERDEAEELRSSHPIATEGCRRDRRSRPT
jgi:hypothetical protein